MKGVKGVFLGYSFESKAYKVLMKNTNWVEESICLIFCEDSVSDLQEHYDLEWKQIDVGIDNEVGTSVKVLAQRGTAIPDNEVSSPAPSKEKQNIKIVETLNKNDEVPPSTILAETTPLVMVVRNCELRPWKHQSFQPLILIMSDI